MASPAMRRFTAAEREHADLVRGVVATLIPGLARALAPRTEVVLHDLTAFPRSIVAIAGSVTGRGIGGPPTDLGLQTLVTEPTDDLVGYRSVLPSGQVLHSSTLFLRAASGRAVAALCINAEIEDLLRAQQFLASLAPSHGAHDEAFAQSEHFPATVEELAQNLLDHAVAGVGAPVDLMKKEQKVAVVRELDSRGFFNLREAAELAARHLQVTRYTVYNYLTEVRA